jgi:hypothetical protein
MMKTEQEEHKKNCAAMKKLIKKFVEKMYGKSEADDPSWDIRALADYIITETKEKE